MKIVFYLVISPHNPFVCILKTRPLPSNMRPIVCFQRQNPNNAFDSIQPRLPKKYTTHILGEHEPVSRKREGCEEEKEGGREEGV